MSGCIATPCRGRLSSRSEDNPHLSREGLPMLSFQQSRHNGLYATTLLLTKSNASFVLPLRGEGDRDSGGGVVIIAYIFSTSIGKELRASSLPLEGKVARAARRRRGDVTDEVFVAKVTFLTYTPHHLLRRSLPSRGSLE